MSLVQANWNKIEITSPGVLKKLFKADKPINFGIDTETDGLFQMTTKPFLIIFGWTPKDHITKKSTVVIFEPTPELMKTMYELCGTVNYGFLHNAKFDLHAMQNGYKAYPHRNLFDTMTMARLVLEALPVDAGGPQLALKALADKYIEKGSSDEQKLIKHYKGLIQREQRDELERAIEDSGHDKKVFRKAQLEKWNSDPVLRIEDQLPAEVLKIWTAWDNKYPATKGLVKPDRVTYQMIYEYSQEAKQAMKAYAYNDVVYTIELGKKFMPYVLEYKQLDTLMLEQRAMFALFASERIGIKIDKKYIQESKVKLVAFITEKRKELEALLGEGFDGAVFPHSPKQIKEWLAAHSLPAEKADKATLNELLERDMPVAEKRILELVMRIRGLIKKFSTDLLGYERMEWNGRRYTVFNQNGAVTGRLSNDMQQMPNAGIMDDEGMELFHPRQAVIPSTDEGYSNLCFEDFSQIEIRIQAHYTWLAMDGKGDKNLLRMYVPFECYYMGELGLPMQWDPTDNTQTKQPFIDAHDWIQLEDNKPWKITDMHMLTARQAFGHELSGLPDEAPLAKKRRKQAKSVNFAIQYRAGVNRVKGMAETPEIGEALFKANKEKFPGLDAYAKMNKKFYNTHGYVQNIYGRKYKMRRYSHTADNYVIQGSGSTILKSKIAECHEFLLNKKSRIIHNIHDEICFEIHDSEPGIPLAIKAIMEDTGDTFIVPMIADIELANTNWREKFELK